MSKVVCLICGRGFDQLTNHLKVHNINVAQYKERYPNAKTISEEVHNKRSNSVSGKNNPFFGREHTEESKDMNRNTKNIFYQTEGGIEVKEKLRNDHLDSKASEDTLKKMSSSHLKFYQTPDGMELREQKSENWEGEKNINNGGISEEHRRHTSEARLKLFQTDKGKKLAKEHGIFMKTAIKEGRIKVHLINKPTKPQIRLYDFLKTIYPDALLEEHIPKSSRIADILIPSQKLVVEYDGFYWHNGKEQEDKKRDVEIQNLGYKVIHIKEDELEDFLSISFLM